MKELNVRKIKKRSQNWLDYDKILLKDLIRENVHIIENKNTDTNSNHSKKEAWKNVLSTFNAMCCGPQRDVKQLKGQWMALKFISKKERSILAQDDSLKTEEGQPSETHPDNDISSWLPGECEAEIKVFDSDSISEAKSTNLHNNAKISSIMRQRALKCIRQSSSSEAENSMNEVVKSNTESEGALYELKIKNEILKHEVLKTKLEYYRKKIEELEKNNDQKVDPTNAQ